MDKAKMHWAVGIFSKLAISKEKRLLYGATQRQKMKEALAKGDKVEGYRAEWILGTMQEVIRTMSVQAEKFNTTYYHDMISVNDFVDVLTSAINKINQIKDDKSKS